MKENRVVLDTNLWISFLISRKYDEIIELINSSTIKLVFSIELFEEFLDVVQRPKFKKYFSDDDISKLIGLFDLFGEMVNVSSKVKICRDKNDDFLLNLCIDGKVDYLVTGDKDLLIIENIENTRILTFKEFLKVVNSQ